MNQINKIGIKQISVISVMTFLFIITKLLIWKDILVCPFHSLTGLYCPGCGGIRCISALIHGDIAGAIESNILLAAFAAAVPFLIMFLLKNPNQKLLQERLNLKYLVIVLTIISVFTIVRNIPYYPFTTLKP